jgi:hypothetical protein
MEELRLGTFAARPSVIRSHKLERHRREPTARLDMPQLAPTAAAQFHLRRIMVIDSAFNRRVPLDGPQPAPHTRLFFTDYCGFAFSIAFLKSLSGSSAVRSRILSIAT